MGFNDDDISNDFDDSDDDGDDKYSNKDMRKKRFKNKNKKDKAKFERERNWERVEKKAYRPKIIYDPSMEDDEDMYDF